MNLILPFDTETSGMVDWKKPSEGVDQPHIVQLAANLVDADTKKAIQSMDVIVKPNGWTISQEMTDIHGITDEMAHDVGIPEKLAVEMFISLWSQRLRVAHNTTFDNRIIRIALKRYFPEWVDLWSEAEAGVDYFCTMIHARKIMGGKQPTLGEAYEHFTGKVLLDAHQASVDTNACQEIYFAIQDLKKPELSEAV